MEPVPAPKTRMQLFEEKLRVLVGDNMSDEEFAKAVKVFNNMLIDISLEHINLALYGESPNTRLAAIKLYYDIIGMTRDKRMKQPAEKPKAETIINCYMTQPVNITAEEHFTNTIREEARLDRKKQLPQ